MPGPVDAITDAALSAHARWRAEPSLGGRLRAHAARIEASLREADLRGAEFVDCRLDGRDLGGARLDGARLIGCTLEGADLRQSRLVETRFERCDLRRAQLAQAVVARTGFLRCHLGDHATGPIGRPLVTGPYVVLAPDLSSRGDGSYIGDAAELDLRWYAPPDDGLVRTFENHGPNGTYRVQILHMHVRWMHERAPRTPIDEAFQTFGTFLDEGAPEVFDTGLGTTLVDRVRGTVIRLQGRWTAPSADG